MVDTNKLKGRCYLVVEDDYFIATDLIESLEGFGIDIIGPAASVREALLLIENEGNRLDGAVLDVNLAEEHVYPVADILRERGIPFVFTTGYDATALPKLYASAPRCKKPINKDRLFKCLADAC
jgi:CheY-like chemotaxis protein